MISFTSKLSCQIEKLDSCLHHRSHTSSDQSKQKVFLLCVAPPLSAQEVFKFWGNYISRIRRIFETIQRTQLQLSLHPNISRLSAELQTHFEFHCLKTSLPSCSARVNPPPPPPKKPKPCQIKHIKESDRPSGVFMLLGVI